MWNWLERWMQRQNELAGGVDADLVRDNRKKWKIGLWLLASSGLLVVVDALFQLPHWIRGVVVFAATACFVISLVVTRWARAESAFLDRPEPKEPTRLFKW